MKKLTEIATNIILVCMVILGVSGCSKVNNENLEVKNLKYELTNLAKESSEKYFGKKIDEKNFEISLAKESKPNEFETVYNIKDVKECYLDGHVKGKPDDVIDFVLVYDVPSKKITKFGIRTIKDKDVVYTNLDK